MFTITRTVVIPPDHKVVIELPPDIPAGEAILTITIEPKREGLKSGIASLRGKGKGEVAMAPDFDAPLEDFAEYM